MTAGAGEADRAGGHGGQAAQTAGRPTRRGSRAGRTRRHMTDAIFRRPARARRVRSGSRRPFLQLVLLAAVVAAGFAPTASMLVTPGKALPLLGRIEVDGVRVSNVPALTPSDHPGAGRGEVLLLTIEARQANVYRWLAGAIGLPSGYALYPRGAVIPPGMSTGQYQRYSEEQMQESAGVASVLASRAAGQLPAEMRAAGVRIAALTGPAVPDGLVQDDVLVAVDGHPVAFTGDLAPLLRGKPAGAEVLLTVRRQDRALDISSRLRQAASGVEEAMLGALLVTWQPVFLTPRAISVDTAGVGGPSGGLALAIAVYEALSGEGMIAGRTVAASGSVRPDGTVGPVGGTRQKAITAARAGADLLLVAAGNGPEARAGAGGALTVVEVGSFDEALDYLWKTRLQGPARTPP